MFISFAGAAGGGTCLFILFAGGDVYVYFFRGAAKDSVTSFILYGAK